MNERSFSDVIYQLFASYLEAITRKYITFKGRTSCAQYWVYFIGMGCTVFFVNFILMLYGFYTGMFSGEVLLYTNFLLGMFYFLPTFAIGMRRFHDIGCSTFSAFFLVFVTLITLCWGGFIIPIILGFIVGNVGKNRFGNDPRDAHTLAPSI